MQKNDVKFPTWAAMIAVGIVLFGVLASGVVSARSSYIDELGNPVDCHFCTVYQPVGEKAVVTLEQALNESAYYARCRRNLPAWLYHRKIELEAQQR